MELVGRLNAAPRVAGVPTRAAGTAGGESQRRRGQHRLQRAAWSRLEDDFVKRAADGSWVDVLLTDDLQPLETELTTPRDQDSAPESSRALLVLTWEGPVPVTLDAAGHLAAGRNEIRGAKERG